MDMNTVYINIVIISKYGQIKQNMGVESLELDPNEGASGGVKNRMNDIEIDQSQQQRQTKPKESTKKR